MQIKIKVKGNYIRGKGERNFLPTQLKKNMVAKRLKNMNVPRDVWSVDGVGDVRLGLGREVELPGLLKTAQLLLDR